MPTDHLNSNRGQFAGQMCSTRRRRPKTICCSDTRSAKHLASSISFCLTGTILPSRPARGACRRAQRRSRMSRSSRPPRQRRVASLTAASTAACFARVRDELESFRFDFSIRVFYQRGFLFGLSCLAVGWLLCFTFIYAVARRLDELDRRASMS
jgi:hypothetical protein